jgi:putative transposase
MTKRSPFRYFRTSPEIIRLAVMLYVRFPLSLRNVEDLIHELGVDVSQETVRFWWNRFGPMFAAEIRRNRVSHMRAHSDWQHYRHHGLWCRWTVPQYSRTAVIAPRPNFVILFNALIDFF